MLNIKYDNMLGFANTETGKKATQAELLQWGLENPMEVKVGEPKLTKAKAPGKIVEEGVESITIKERV